MSNLQIPNLPAAIALNGTEQLEAVQAGMSVKVTVAQLGDYVATQYPAPGVSSIATSSPITGGTITATGTIGLETAGVSNLYLASMPSGTVKANVTGSPSSPVDATPSAILDLIGSSRGSLLYRGANNWLALGPATAGYVLISGGVGADPQWLAPGSTASLMVGTTPVLGGSSGRLLYDNAGILGATNFAMVPANATAAEITTLASQYDALIFAEKLTNLGADEIDLSAFSWKQFVSLYNGTDSLIESTAPVMLRVGGSHNNFVGPWSFKGTGGMDGQTAIHIEPEGVEFTDLRFEDVYFYDVSIGVHVPKGAVTGVHFDSVFARDVGHYIFRLLSNNPYKEIGYVTVGWIDANSRSNYDYVAFQLGPDVGSGGKMGLEIDSGIIYRGQHAIQSFGVLDVESATWSGGIATYELNYYHELSEGDCAFFNGFSPTGWNNSTVAIAAAPGGMVWSAGVMTIETSTPHGLSVGDPVQTYSCSPYTYLLYDARVAEVLSSTQFTVEDVEDPGGALTRVGVVVKGFICAAGTTGKTITVAMSDPGAATTLGYWLPYWGGVLTGGVFYSTVRKMRVTNLSVRGPIGSGVYADAGADWEFRGVTIDDPGVSLLFNLPVLDIVYTAGSPGYITTTIDLAEAIAEGLIPPGEDLTDYIAPGDYFVIQLARPADFTGTYIATSVTADTLVADIVYDPGVYESGANVDIPDPAAINSHCYHFTERFQGTYRIIGGSLHEPYGNAIRDEAVYALPRSVIGVLAWNYSWGFPGVNSGFYADPACSGITIEGGSFGTGDHWRHATRSFVFSANPSDGNYLEFGPTATATRLTFRTVVTTTNEVAIGATIADTLESLYDFITSSMDANLTAINPVLNIVAGGSPVGTGSSLFMIHYAGSVGQDYNIAKSGAGITISPNGTRLGGGTGAATGKYGIEGLRAGVRGNAIINVNLDNNISGPLSLAPQPLVVYNTYTSSNTFNGYDGAEGYNVMVWAGGGGGGSGRRGAAGSARSGGIGGGVGVLAQKYYRAADIDFSSPITVTVGAGGTGGAAVTADNTSGNDGTAGGASTFGAYLKSYGGPGGWGGAAAAVNSITGPSGLSAVQTGPYVYGRTSSVTAAAAATYGTMSPAAAFGGGVGGTGGGLSTANAELLGSQADFAGWADPGLSAPVGPAAAKVAGTAGSTSSQTGFAGYGGGGGGPSADGVTAAGAGGAGGRASGGGGGGASTNGANSGGGGAGGSGLVVVATYFPSWRS